jgi:succinate dehydrogenase / fumarate reductase cytochrome b subunit
MQALKNYLTSSIGRKQIMGVSGIILYGYLFVHLLGNIGLLAGAERFNKYGYLLLHHLAEIIVPVEIVLFVAFALHVVLAIQLKRENRAARPQAYAVNPNHGKKTLYSRTMMVTGIVILLFTVIHVAHFRFGYPDRDYMVTYAGVEMRDLYRTAMEYFSHWWYAGAYVLVMLLIASHLAHGVQSSLQTLGFSHPKYRPAVHWAGVAYAALIAGGFSFLAIWAFLKGMQGGAV